jgi:hypothetical protein
MEVAIAVPVTRKKGRPMRGVKPVMATVVQTKKKKKTLKRGTVAAAKKIAKAQGTEMKGPLFWRWATVLRSPFSYGGGAGVTPTYVTPTFIPFTREQWSIPRGYTDVQRIGNEIIPVKWVATVDVTLPANCWFGNDVTPTSTANRSATTSVFYNGANGRTYWWPAGTPFDCMAFLGRTKSMPNTAVSDVSSPNVVTVQPVAWERFFESDNGAGAHALTNNPVQLAAPNIEITDHWEIKKRWRFTLSSELTNGNADYVFDTAQGESAALEMGSYADMPAGKGHYPSTKRLTIDLTKYLPKVLKYDDDTAIATTATARPGDMPGNVKPLIFFVLAWPRGSYMPTRYNGVDITGAKPTVPAQSGANISTWVSATTVSTWMDP